jgi:hypothetical protein
MPRYPQGGGGQIDMSGIAGLGEFGQNALGMVLAQQQQDAQMNLARRAQAAEEANAAAQNEIRRQIGEQEAEAAKKTQDAARQTKIMDLAKLSKDGESFEKVAQYLLPDLTPLERDFGRTFADETSRVKREKEKADKLEKEQSMNRGFLQQGGLDAFADIPRDQRSAALAARAPAFGMDPNTLGFVVEGLEAKRARIKAEKVAEEAKKDARARIKASGGGGLSPKDRDITIDRIRRQYRMETGKFDEAFELGEGAISAQDDARGRGVADQRLADAALLRGYARVLNPIGVLSDKDVPGTIGELPGFAGSLQRTQRVMSGLSVLNEGERAYMRRDLERRLGRIGERRRNAAANAATRAKRAGIEPADVLDTPSFSGVSSGSGSTGGAPSPGAVTPPSESEYRIALVAARKLYNREPTEQEIMDMLKLKMGQ